MMKNNFSASDQLLMDFSDVIQVATCIIQNMAMSGDRKLRRKYRVLGQIQESRNFNPVIIQATVYRSNRKATRINFRSVLPTLSLLG